MVQTDPLYGDQWHFAQLGTLGGELLINRIWDEFDGTGIFVGVYDDGVEINHVDLNDNYNSARHVVINGVAISGNATAADATHGTSVAGLIAAERNGTETMGIAYGADITGVNIFNASNPIYVNSANPAAFMQAARQGTNFDVVNHSWGSSPFFDANQNTNVAGSFAADLVAAYQHLSTTGRGGLGTIVLQAAGNEGAQADGDGVNNSRFTITVGALHNDGFASSYSNYGASLLVSAGAGDYADVRNGLGIVTADRTGTVGYNLRNNATGNFAYTNDFGGTSSATPITTGVVTLMLDANAGLGWRDVQNILATSASHTGSAIGGATTNGENNTWFVNDATNWNGGGMHFSEDYGYGKVNAFAAVRMAEVWNLFGAAQTSANEQSVSSTTFSPNLAIPDQSTLNYQFNVAGNLALEHVSLRVNLTHSYFRDLRIFLTSPTGTEVQVYDGSDADGEGEFFPSASGGLNWTFGLEAFRGELIAGTWTLRIEDAAAGDSGTLSTVQLTGFGTVPPTNDVYHYTDEFSAMVSQDATRATLNDTDGGTDWVNAAAITGNINLNLNAGAASTNNGAAFFTIAAAAVIENAVTGDGNDVLTGNAAANALHGMRGNDLLTGGGGADNLFGGAGNDTFLHGGTPDGRDTMDGGTGTDLLDLSSMTTFAWVDLLYGDHEIWTQVSGAWLRVADLTAIENVIGTSLNDQMRGNAENNVLRGLAGTDTIYGRAGNDTITGGAGNDTLFGEAGNDTFLISGTTDGRDAIDGGTESDTIDLSAMTTFAWVDMQDPGDDVRTQVGTIWTNLANLTSVENAIGTSLGDQLFGDANNNSFAGLGGVDTINGRAGNDTLSGGAGNDTLFGEAGNDTFLISGAADARDVINGGTEIDTIDLSAMTTLAWVDLQYGGDEVYTSVAGAWVRLADLVSVENVIGTAVNDQLFGDANANVLSGRGGNDLMTGRGGVDTFRFDVAAFGTDTVNDFVDGTDRLAFTSVVADNINDFTIAGNGTTQVTLTLTGTTNSVLLKGAAPITITAADFDFLV